MSINTELFKSVLNGTDESLKKLGFEAVKDENSSYITVSEEEASAKYIGESGVLKFVYTDERVILYSGTDTENTDDTPTKMLTSLLADNADARDVKYVVSEMDESLNEKFGQKTSVKKKSAQKVPQTVSKNAVKNGSFYDPNTLASKLCLVFPELREIHKENIATYGEFLSEDFFVNHATPKVIEAIKENKPQTMKKLFQILNEIYEDGTNDTQSLIAVTILGELNNDQILLARCVDYMSETMAPPVIEVNKYLATRSGKKAKAKMKNPPAYKPKKEKKKGFFANMMSQGMNAQQ
ncbi:MAG: hypothetical protein NC122_03540 [Faecalibacterium sp.]|nr:hypothetical protein [Ruminococcus sp.]MCM1391485.1 hypothetical protein [Ruminococcus sp.]MCM1485257.1 hypothetical protein [Faecalibacterium sp.]